MALRGRRQPPYHRSRRLRWTDGAGAIRKWSVGSSRPFSSRPSHHREVLHPVVPSGQTGRGMDLCPNIFARVDTRTARCSETAPRRARDESRLDSHRSKGAMFVESHSMHRGAPSGRVWPPSRHSVKTSGSVWLPTTRFAHDIGRILLPLTLLSPKSECQGPVRRQDGR